MQQVVFEVVQIHEMIFISDEQERVQKKTFVNWINSYLGKHVPPLRIQGCNSIDILDGLNPSLNRRPIRRLPKGVHNLVLNPSLKF